MRMFLGGAILASVVGIFFSLHVLTHGFWPTVVAWSLSIGVTGLIVLGIWLITGS